MTPDANPLLGPLPGVRGFWVAAGLSLNGFGGGGGIGRAMAGWITAGDPGVDIGPYRAWRFGDVYRDPGFAAGLARETYADYYRLRYPFDADLAGRPRRLSALHGRLQEAGAVFGTKAGWERADYHDPGQPWRRAGRDQAAYGWARPPWFERVGLEARAVRERAGIIDLSSFGKIAVEGPGALGLLQRVSANDIDRPVGAVVYTQWCDERGGMVADVTVTRLADDRFRVVTGAGYLASEMAWLRSHLADADGPVAIRDVSGELATIGLWGPRARDVLVAAGAPADEVGNDAIPMRRARAITVGPAPVHASRISYAGELGWELTMPTDWAVVVWDRLRAAGTEFGVEPFGYRALDALRMEKGYRYFGTDLTMLDTPFEAGLGAFVRLENGPFIGREALVAARAAQPDGPAVGCGRVADRRRRLPARLRRRGRPARRRRRRPAPQRRLRPDRRAHDRLRLPAGATRRARRSRSTSSTRASRRSSGRMWCRPGRRADARLMAVEASAQEGTFESVSIERNHRRWSRGSDHADRPVPASVVPLGQNHREERRAPRALPAGSGAPRPQTACSQPSNSGPSIAPSRASNVPRRSLEIEVDRRDVRLDGAPQRPADVGHDHLETHPGQQGRGGVAEVGRAQLGDLGVVVPELLGGVAELEGRVVLAAVLLVDDPQPLAVVEVVLGEQVVVARDGRQRMDGQRRLDPRN